MKFNKDKVFEYLQYREQQRGKWENIVRWGMMIAVIIYGISSKEYEYAFAIAIVVWFLPVIIIPWINGKVTGSNWYINLTTRSRERLYNGPKWFRYIVQTAAVILVCWAMNGFKFWPIG